MPTVLKPIPPRLRVRSGENHDWEQVNTQAKADMVELGLYFDKMIANSMIAASNLTKGVNARRIRCSTFNVHAMLRQTSVTTWLGINGV